MSLTFGENDSQFADSKEFLELLANLCADE